MMTCQEMDERIEAIAAGDEPAGAALLAHIEACPGCAAALARARAIEAALAARPVPAAPARFAAAVTSRIRREYWRSEQQVDRMFNVAVAAGLIAVAGGTLALVNLSAVTDAIAVGLSALNALATEQGGATATQAAPAFSTYLLGGGFLVTAVLVWSWAERSGRSNE
jgi:anti-sigma factor RsiW